MKPEEQWQVVLKCPDCESERIARDADGWACNHCGTRSMDRDIFETDTLEREIEPAPVTQAKSQLSAAQKAKLAAIKTERGLDGLVDDVMRGVRHG